MAIQAETASVHNGACEILVQNDKTSIIVIFNAENGKYNLIKTDKMETKLKL